MKNLRLYYLFLSAILINTILLFSGCYEFDFVIQPDSAELNSSFEVQVSITTDSDANNGEYTPYFGIKLPVGWTVQDSIEFTYLQGVLTGKFVYSDSLVQEMNLLDPPEIGYYWWVGAGMDSVAYFSDDTFLFNPIITTDSSSGKFYLDYMAGDSDMDWQSGQGLNRKRSDNHFIGIDLVPYAEVTNSNDAGPGSLRDAISRVEIDGTVAFAIAETDIIELLDEIQLRQNISIIGPDDYFICISGQYITRIFNIFDSNYVEISNLDLVNGYGENGGGIFCKYSTLIIKNSNIRDCSAATAGGGVMCEMSQLFIDHVVVSGCSAEEGGGIWLNNSSPSGKFVIVSGCNSYIGGGIYLNNSDLFLQNALINDNVAASHGGGIYCGDSEPIIQNVTVAYNQAVHGAGFHIYKWYTNTEFQVQNSVIFGNSPYNIYLGSYTLNDSPSMSFFYSDLEGGPEGIVGLGDVFWDEGNIDVDPLFDIFSEHPYQLSAASPCIDAGNPDTTGMILPFWDLIGNYRMWDGNMDGDTIVDIGAYEFGSIGVGAPELQDTSYGLRVSAYPNPFPEIVHIEYEILKSSRVSIQVFNAIGEMVAVLRNGISMEGKQQVAWNAGGLPSGLYFCRVQAGGEVAVVKLVKR